MSFSEAVKLTVKRKAHFACCLCRGVGIELHHIVPQADGGPDTEDNAAPLCPSCHETYGANPTKRKFIREARDFWFEICATRYGADANRLDALQQMLQQLPTKSDMEQMILRVSSTSSAQTISANPTQTDMHAPIEILSQEVTVVALHQYLRFMYGCLSHCGQYTLSKLAADLTAIGHLHIHSLHSLLALSRGVVAEFVQDHRDRGDNMDRLTDEFPVRLLLPIFDEVYCAKYHPAVHAKYADKNWVRPLTSRAV